MIKQLWQRILCMLNKHRDTCFTSYPVITGNLRVVRCLNCHQMLDVVVMRDFDMQNRMETALRSVPGYPAERIR